jgi:hypothetical protein
MMKSSVADTHKASTINEYAKKAIHKPLISVPIIKLDGGFTFVELIFQLDGVAHVMIGKR